jgi:predicted transcriptional regulator
MGASSAFDCLQAILALGNALHSEGYQSSQLKTSRANINGSNWDRAQNVMNIEAIKIAYAESVPLDWNCRALAEGLACYRKGEFFQAHEHWEAVWLTLAEPEKSFLQALIQVTAAFHHLAAGNSAGTASLLRRVLRRLGRCPSHFGGIAVTPLCAEISEWLRMIESGARSVPAAHPQIHPTEPPPIENT